MMKKILYILLFCSVGLQAQKISDLPAASGYGDDDDLTVVVEDGTTKKMSKASFFHHSTIYVNTLSEYSAANGIYVDGLRIKDGNIHLGLGYYYYLDDDLDSYFYGNADDDIELTVGNVLSFSATGSLFSLNLNTVPNVNNTYDFGSTTKYWANLYSKRIYADTIYEITEDAGVHIDGLKIYESNIYLPTSSFIFLDDDADTYIWTTSDDNVRFNANDIDVFDYNPDSVIFKKDIRLGSDGAHSIGSSDKMADTIWTDNLIVDESLIIESFPYDTAVSLNAKDYLLVVQDGEIKKLFIENTGLTFAPSEDIPGGDFSGTLYKSVTFSEVATGALDQSEWQTMLGSTDLTHYIGTGHEVDAADSTRIVTINGLSDTVRVVTMGDWEGHTGDAVTVNGAMFINGVDATDDTLTDVCFKMSVIFCAYPYSLSNGGKIGGVGGAGVTDVYPFEGGYYDCGCEKTTTQEWCDDDGFAAPLAFYEGSGYEDVFVYGYTHEMTNFDCLTEHYARAYGTNSRVYNDSTWYNFTTRIKLNTGSSYNGIIEIFENDTCIYSNTQVKIRDNANIRIDYWLLETFAGGTPESGWAGGVMHQDDLMLFDPKHSAPYGVGAVMYNIPDHYPDNIAE